MLRFLTLLALCFVAITPHDACAFQFSDGDRWSRTATDGSGLSQGDPTTLTWGIVADGTSINGSEPKSPSDLIATMNGLHGAGLWISLFEDALGRWAEVSGLSYVPELNDSSATINGSAFPFGTLGSVPDVRIGGHSIDGQSGTNTLAYNYFPNHGDMVLDTDNTTFYGNTSNDSRALRNVLMHEAGHSIGIKHVESDNASFLMEPFINTSFDGPQLDDILAAHRAYGDAWEENGGNDTLASATPLGALASGSPLSIGTDATDTVVAASDVDFFSIDDNSDTDYFAFTTSASGLLDVTLTPRGPTYNEGPQDGSQSSFNTASQSDLTLTLFDTDGSTSLLTVNANPAGSAETVIDFDLSQTGMYFVSVTGTADAAQFYQLDLSIEVPLMLGDMNGDGVVDSLDVPLFVQALVDRGAYDAIGFPIDADISGDVDNSGLFDLGDLSAFNTLFASTLATAQSVPEPPSILLLLTAIACLVSRGRKERGWVGQVTRTWATNNYFRASYQRRHAAI